MSYDLYFVIADERGVEAAVEALMDEELSEATAESERRKQAVADELMRENPDFERFIFDFGKIAKAQMISEEEARATYRRIELSVPEGGYGIQVSVGDDEGALTVPYHHEGASALPVLEEIASYSRIFARHGFTIYDPQLGQVLDVERDFRSMHSAYAGIADRMDDFVRSPRKKVVRKKRPWWKFW